MGLADQICRISTVDATLPWRANPDPETCQTVLSSLQSNPDAIFVLQNTAAPADQPRWQDDPLVLVRCDLQTPGSGHKHAFTTSDEVRLQKTSGVAQRACRVHIVSMTHDSKIFVGLRSTRKRSPAASEPKGPKCQWDGCEKIGTHRAPVGPGAEGLYLLFCLEHVAAYNKGYSFTAAPSSPDVARYQKEATMGARPTLGKRVNEPTEAPLPSSVRSGSAKTLNARKGVRQGQTTTGGQQRKLKTLEAKAFDTLGLSHQATSEEIKSRYKERLKMHHPDANQGDRNSEDALRASIEAYRILKLNGFC